MAMLPHSLMCRKMWPRITKLLTADTAYQTATVPFLSQFNELLHSLEEDDQSLKL